MNSILQTSDINIAILIKVWGIILGKIAERFDNFMDFTIESYDC